MKETTVKVEDHGYKGPVFAESDEGRTVIGYGLAPSEDDYTEVEPEDIKLRPSIFMPRAMSRITLEIIRVRVERLQDISEADCFAEGCAGGFGSIAGYGYAATAFEHYHWLWNSLNGKGAFEANPWVWVIEFKRVQP